MKMYGLITYTHFSQKVLTVMGPRGASEIRKHLSVGPDLIDEANRTGLPRLLEKCDGALQSLVHTHGIILLNKTAWDQKKAQLGIVDHGTVQGHQVVIF